MSTVDVFTRIANRRKFADFVDMILLDVLNHEIKQSGEPEFNAQEQLVVKSCFGEQEHEVSWSLEDENNNVVEDFRTYVVTVSYRVWCENDQVKIGKDYTSVESDVVIDTEIITPELGLVDKSALLYAYKELANNQ